MNTRRKTPSTSATCAVPSIIHRLHRCRNYPGFLTGRAQGKPVVKEKQLRTGLEAPAGVTPWSKPTGGRRAGSSEPGVAREATESARAGLARKGSEAPPTKRQPWVSGHYSPRRIVRLPGKRRRREAAAEGANSRTRSLGIAAREPPGE